MSIIIPGSRFSSSVRAIERNGTPPYAKMITEKNRRDPDASGERRRCVAEDILNGSLKKMTGTRERERYSRTAAGTSARDPSDRCGPRDLRALLVNVRAVVVVVFVPSMGVGSLGVAVSGLDFVIVV